MSLPKCVVLGGGMVGSVIAADLTSSFDVTVADYSEEALKMCIERSKGAVKTVQADLSKKDILLDVVKGTVVLVNAVPGWMGCQTLKTVIEAGEVKKICDISFMPEDAVAELDDLCKKHGVVLVVDIGVAPGISHMLVGAGWSTFEHCETAAVYVGGLPKYRTWPYEYKAPFSPIDVLEEYTRDTYVVEHGEIAVHPALSGVELMDMPGVGSVEAFYTDGLRSLLKGTKADNIYEKTFRYPGQPQFLRAIRESGFFRTDTVQVKDAKTGELVNVRPIDVSAKLLFPLWTYAKGEVDITLMRVIVDGKRKDGSVGKEVWTLYDELDEKTGYPAMSRTTGYPCAICMRLVHDGTLAKPGVLVPEELGKDAKLFEHFVKELGVRGVKLVHEEGKGI